MNLYCRRFFLFFLTQILIISSLKAQSKVPLKDLTVPSTSVTSNTGSATISRLLNNRNGANLAWVDTITSTSIYPTAVISLPAAKTIVGYSISNVESLYPGAWALYGSTDNSNFYFITSQKIDTTSWRFKFSRRIYQVNNTTAYRYYKLIDSTVRNTGLRGSKIGELELFDSLAISGTVFADSNLNRVKDNTEAALSGYTVYLKTLDSNSTIAASTTTDANGYYSFGPTQFANITNGAIGYAVTVKPQKNDQIRSSKSPQIGLMAPTIFADGTFLAFADTMNKDSAYVIPNSSYYDQSFNIYQNIYQDSGLITNFGILPASTTMYVDNNFANLITNQNNGTFGTIDSTGDKFFTLHPNNKIFNYLVAHSELYSSVTDYAMGSNYSSMAGNANGSNGLLTNNGTYAVTSYLGSLYGKSYKIGMLNESHYGWRATYGATTGAWNDCFLAVNGTNDGSNITPNYSLVFGDTVSLTSNNNYSMGFYGKGANTKIQDNSGTLANTVIDYKVMNSSNTVIASGTYTIQKSTSSTLDSVNLGWQIANTNFTANASGQYYIYFMIVSHAAAGNDVFLDNFYLRKSSYKISGVVYNDQNGLVDNLVNGTAKNTINGKQLYAYLIDTSTNLVTAIDTVKSDGTYNLFAPQFSRYKVGIADSLYTAGVVFGGLKTNSGFRFIGGNLGSNNAYGSSNTLVNSIPVYPSVTSTDITNVNFGLDSIPVSIAKSYNISQPQVGAVIVLNNNNTALPGQLTGTDKEDGTYNGTNLTSNVKVFLPNYGQLYYNSKLITADTIISKYDASKLTLKLTGSGYTNVTFKYAFIDSALVRSDSVNYVITWNYPLPVKFGSFTAQKQGSTALLNWTTESEENNKGFYIQRSADSKTWNDLGFVSSKAASGNSSSTLSYEFTDDKPLQNNNFYRIEQTDLDGNTNLSVIRLLTFGTENGNLVYPNPVTKGQIVTVTDINIKEVALYNSAGQNLSNCISKNGDVYFVNTSTLSSGIYNVLIIKEDGTFANSKIVIE